MIELQRKLIGDRVRNEAFLTALKATLRRGDEVIDLGTGTGVLAFLARRLGARHVTCIEIGDICNVAKKLARRNKVTGCTFLNVHSTEVTEAPPADLLIAELLGNYALEENIIEAVEDMKRLLKPSAKIMPSCIRQYACPVTRARLHDDIDVWQTNLGVDFLEARDVTLNNMYVRTITPADLLEYGMEGICIDTIDFSRKNASVRTKQASWRLERPTEIYGIALWWEADLAPGVTLSTSPLSKPTHWEQIYLPLLHPLDVRRGDTLLLTLYSDSRWHVKINVRWNLEHLRKGQALSSQSLDMRRGYLG